MIISRLKFARSTIVIIHFHFFKKVTLQIQVQFKTRLKESMQEFSTVCNENITDYLTLLTLIVSRIIFKQLYGKYATKKVTTQVPKEFFDILSNPCTISKKIIHTSIRNQNRKAEKILQNICES